MPTTPAQRLAELRRELATRERVYPDWVRAAKLTQASADHRQQVLREVLADLEQLYQLAPLPVQAPLFPPGQLPPAKHPTRGHYVDH